MSSAPRQATFFEKASTGERAEIVTDGRTIRPVADLLNALVEEVKLTLSEDGLRTTYVDAANVAIGSLHVRPAAFESFDATGEETVGFSTADFRSLISDARMSTRTNDAVELEIDADATLVTIEKEYTETTVRKTDSLLNIDPDSVRQEPDPPALDLPAEATVDVEAFHDVVTGMAHDYVDLAVDDGHLIATSARDAEMGRNKTLADFGAVAAGDDVRSKFSLNYLTDIVAALKKAKVAEVGLSLGDEMPIYLDWERTQETDDGAEEILYSGRFMLAPRLKDGEDR